MSNTTAAPSDAEIEAARKALADAPENVPQLRQERQRELDALIARRNAPPPAPPRVGPSPVVPSPANPPAPANGAQRSTSAESGAARRYLREAAARESRRATSSMHYVPTMEEIRGLVLETTQASVATAGTVDEIGRFWVSRGAPNNNVGLIALDIAWQCKDNGSSRFTQLAGISPYWPNTERYVITGHIKQFTTLRRFCMYYAKMIWVMMLEHQMPPANWVSLGYKEEHKYAAFDFFQGVLNGAALAPDTLIRDPSPQEIQAHMNNASIAYHDSVVHSGIKSTTDLRITGGTIGMKPQLLIEGPDD
ncbi:MAG: ORF10 protein [Hibiscus virus X]